MADSEETTDGEAEAEDFDSLVEKHSDFVFNVAFRMMGNAEDAEDVARDAFLSAYRAFDRFRGESRPTTWLYRITVNAALMRLRKTKVARALTKTGLDDVEVVDWTASPEREAVNAELGDRLQEGISRLDPDLRAAVVLRDVQGFSNAESADALDISVPALKSRLHRARVLLREFLSDYVGKRG
jgi:RNA polymerase sigma-70 factor (ECF subfamily)